MTIFNVPLLHHLVCSAYHCRANPSLVCCPTLKHYPEDAPHVKSLTWIPYTCEGRRQNRDRVRRWWTRGGRVIQSGNTMLHLPLLFVVAAEVTTLSSAALAACSRCKCYCEPVCDTCGTLGADGCASTCGCGESSDCNCGCACGHNGVCGGTCA